MYIMVIVGGGGGEVVDNGRQEHSVQVVLFGVMLFEELCL